MRPPRTLAAVQAPIGTKPSDMHMTHRHSAHSRPHHRLHMPHMQDHTRVSDGDGCAVAPHPGQRRYSRGRVRGRPNVTPSCHPAQRPVTVACIGARGSRIGSPHSACTRERRTSSHLTQPRTRMRHQHERRREESMGNCTRRSRCARAHLSTCHQPCVHAPVHPSLDAASKHTGRPPGINRATQVGQPTPWLNRAARGRPAEPETPGKSRTQ